MVDRGTRCGWCGRAVTEGSPHGAAMFGRVGYGGVWDERGQMTPLCAPVEDGRVAGCLAACYAERAIAGAKV